MRGEEYAHVTLRCQMTALLRAAYKKLWVSIVLTEASASKGSGSVYLETHDGGPW